MTYDQFWNDDCTLVKYYREAAEIKRDIKNQDLWLQGMYIYEALLDVSPMYRAFKPKKAEPYPKEPYNLFPKSENKTGEKEKQQMEATKNRMLAITEAINTKFEKEGGGVNG